ncbi:uncharacterized protein LOC113147471, partial [Cyclospora cayetanensis]|uniref:Uncharacterized protein LOC113147471 n=1 Tax=Cyclospora cayetanensis TaxID=88456 RepID=A0A6P6S2D0_9EIME
MAFGCVSRGITPSIGSAILRGVHLCTSAVGPACQGRSAASDDTPSLLQSLQDELQKTEALLQPEGCASDDSSSLLAPRCQQQRQLLQQQQQEAITKSLESLAAKAPDTHQEDDQLQILLKRAVEGPGEGGVHLFDVYRIREGQFGEAGSAALSRIERETEEAAEKEASDSAASGIEGLSPLKIAESAPEGAQRVAAAIRGLPPHLLKPRQEQPLQEEL